MARIVCSRMFIWILCRVEEGVIACLLIGMVLLTFTQVLLRYVFSTGIDWVLELTYYLFGWLVVFGASYAVKEGSQLGIDVLVKMLPPARRRLIGLVVAALCLIYAGIFILGGLQLVVKIFSVGIEAEDMAIQRWILLSGLPIGFVLLLFRFGQIAWRIWTGKDPGFRLGHEARAESVQLRPSEASESGESGANP